MSNESDLVGIPKIDQMPEEVTLGMTTEDKPKRGRPRKADQTVASQANELAPDLATLKSGAEEYRWYWLGVDPIRCPCDQLTIGGECYSKYTEQVTRERNGTKRIPQLGDLVKMTREKVEKMRASLPLTIIRPFKGAHEEEGAGENVGDPYIRIQAGKPITRRSQATLDEMRKAGRPGKAYRYEKGDQPVAKFLYCVPADLDHKGKPIRGAQMPSMLSETDLVWSEE
jgi:hypothetical protein